MRKAARLIVCDPKGRFLVVHTTKEGRNRWEFPGGKVDEPEWAKDAAARETKEETGILIGRVQFVCKRRVEFLDGDDWDVTFFYTEEWQGTPKLMEPDKADAVEFKSLDELDALPQIPRLCVDVARFFIRGRV